MRQILILLVVLLCGCGGTDDSGRSSLRFWAMGREGEVVTELVRDFEREHPDINVRVQQIPWSAAHEKLLTSFVGRSTPDLAQIGNTWIAEFAALHALEALDARIASSRFVDPSSFFPGIWETNVIEENVYGVPWYVDTRVLFYRRDILEQAGYGSIPTTWSGWLEAMAATKAVVGEDRYAIFLPINEWTQPAILGLQAGSPLLAEDATTGAFSAPDFRRAFAYYLDMFRSGFAPPVANTEISNIYQEFARGYFAMYVTGPWNLGEFRRRLPPEMKDDWATAPLPGPEDGKAVSLAGGASLVLFQRSKQKEAAWKLIEYLSQPEQQVRFYEMSGDLPARLEAWGDSTLLRDRQAAAFGEQLRRVVATPKIPEWEQIAIRLQEHAERAIREATPPESALVALDDEVNRILEKRRWLLAHKQIDTDRPSGADR